jgi:putative membrane protein
MPSLRKGGLPLALVLIALGLPAFAHTGEAIEPHDLWTAWEWDPGVVIPLALSAWLYWRGSRPLWRAGRPGHGIRNWEAAAFWSGWLTLFIALCSPIHPLGEVLFSAHMVQHELIMLVAAPLFVLGRPLIGFLWGLPMSWRRALGGWSKGAAFQAGWRWLTKPAIATLLMAVTLWVWHAPALYQATLTSDMVHSLQHLCFLLASLLFWWAIIRGREGRAAYGAAVLYLFVTLLQSSVLGALFTFSTAVFYPAYDTAAMRAWGFTPLGDQITAGLIMWVPAGLVYIGAALILFAAYLHESDRRADRWWQATLEHGRSEDLAL